MRPFKKWLTENNKINNEGLQNFITGGAKMAANLMGLPGSEELGLDGSVVTNAAKQAWMQYGDKFKSITPEQKATLNQNCFNKKRRDDCQILCNKVGNKKACSMIGVGKVGRRTGITDPFKYYK